jgi:aminopeptidase N
VNPAAAKQAAVWPIPLLPTSKLSAEVLDTAEARQELKARHPELLLNHDRTGFYLTIYDRAHTAQLAAAVAAGRINDLDRLGLLSDNFEAAKAGYAPTTQALQLLAAYSHESSAVVWDIIAANLGSIRMVMDDEELRNAMRPFTRELVARQLKRLGWEEKDKDSHFDRLLRPVILGLASFGDEPSVVAEAQKRFKAAKTSEDIHPDLRGVVYGTISRLGGPAEFDKLLALHNASNNSEERVTLATALTNFEQPELIKRSLKLITSDDVRLQDAPYWIAYSFMNRHARRDTWDWLTEHWSWLTTNLGHDLSFFRMPIYAGRCFSDLDFLPEFKKFFEAKLTPAFDRPFKQAIEMIEWQAAWKQRDLATLKKFFKS